MKENTIDNNTKRLISAAAGSLAAVIEKFRDEARGDIPIFDMQAFASHADAAVATGRLIAKVAAMKLSRRDVVSRLSEKMRDSVNGAYNQIYHLMNECDKWIRNTSRSRQTTSTRPVARKDVYNEIAALFDEYEEVIVGDSCVSITTEPIELAYRSTSVGLGRFRITVSWQSDTVRRPAQAGDPINIGDAVLVEALDPVRSKSNSNYVHPHVADGIMCLGEAAAPAQLALSSGRLFDVFQLLVATLGNYNSKSPFIALETWELDSCQNCGGTIDLIACSGCGSTDCSCQLRECRQCDSRNCDECTSVCCVCDDYLCGDGGWGCATSCYTCGDRCCIEGLQIRNDDRLRIVRNGGRQSCVASCSSCRNATCRHCWRFADSDTDKHSVLCDECVVKCAKDGCPTVCAKTDIDEGTGFCPHHQGEFENEQKKSQEQTAVAGSQIEGGGVAGEQPAPATAKKRAGRKRDSERPKATKVRARRRVRPRASKAT